MITLDTTNLCSHLQKKLFEDNGVYHRLWLAMQDDPPFDERLEVFKTQMIPLAKYIDNIHNVILPLYDDENLKAVN